MKARVLVVVTVFVLTGVPLGLVGSQVAAQSVMSSGCELLNDPGWDVGPWAGIFWSFADPLELFASEVISVTAGPPGAGVPFSIEFVINESIEASGRYPGPIVYVVPADRADVTRFRLFVYGTAGTTTTFNVECAPAPDSDLEPETAVLPGCDALLPIPETAVGGTFVADAPIYWTPGELTSPLVTIKAGNSARVLGLDASGEYYQIIWVCDYVWVPKATLGPNYDAVWNGAPLPTAVVQ